MQSKYEIELDTDFEGLTSPDRPPEHKLLACMLWNAILDFEATEKQIKREAERWFLSNKEGFGTYLFCCDHLELSAEKIRNLVFTGSKYTDRMRSWL